MRSNLLLICIIAFVGCNETETSKVVFESYAYSIDGVVTSQVDYSMEYMNNPKQIKYMSAGDSLVYQIDPSNGGWRTRSNKDSTRLTLKGIEEYIIDGKFFRVRKLSFNSQKLDAEIETFWIDSIGVFIEKSVTWENFIRLILHPDLDPATLEKIYSVLVNDDFYDPPAKDLSEEREKLMDEISKSLEEDLNQRNP